jgi:hypothetical protein
MLQQQLQLQLTPVQPAVPGPRPEDAALCSALQQQVDAVQQQFAAASSSRAELLHTWSEQQHQLQLLGSALQQALSQQQPLPPPQHNHHQQQQQQSHDLASVLSLLAQLHGKTQQQATARSAKQQQLVVLQAQAASLQQQAGAEEAERSESKVQLALLFADRQASKAQLKQLRADMEQLRQQAAPGHCDPALLSLAGDAAGVHVAEAVAPDGMNVNGSGEGAGGPTVRQPRSLDAAVATAMQVAAPADAGLADDAKIETDAAVHGNVGMQQQQSRQLPRKRRSSSPDDVLQPAPPAAKKPALYPGEQAIDAGAAAADGISRPIGLPLASISQQQTQQQSAATALQQRQQQGCVVKGPPAACDFIDLSQDDDNTVEAAGPAAAAAAAPAVVTGCRAPAQPNRRPAEEQPQAVGQQTKGSNRQASPSQPAAAAAGSRLPVIPGIHEVTKPRDMQQLQALLAASPAWGFSVAFDTDAAALPRPTGRSSAAAAAVAAAAAAADDDDWLTDGLPLQQQQQQQQRLRRSKEWSWAVLGVAFSVADGCAYYVPLTRKIPGVVEAAGDPVRVGSSERMKQLWQGLADIFCSSKGSSRGPAGSSNSSSIAAVAAAAQACSAAVDALVDPVLAAGDVTGQVKTVDLSNVCPPAAAADAWGFGSTSLNSSSRSRSCVSTGASYGLKSQLAALASPPAASGFAGFVVDGPVVDVRVASWLLAPDDKATEEDTKGAGGRR